MLFEETRSIRAFVGRIDEGDDVVESLTLLCDANDLTSASLRLSGTLRDVELVTFDTSRREYTPIVDAVGPFEIVHLDGRMARLGDQPVLRIDALLTARGPAGPQLVFGQLRRATADECEFVVETYTDLVVERRLDPASGRFPIASIATTAAPASRAETQAPAPTPAPAPRERREPETVAEPAGMATAAAGTQKSEISWADAMEASAEIKPASQRDKGGPRKPSVQKSADEIYGDVDFDEVMVKAGDILDHPKLGECRVIRVEDDEYAHIRLSRGQIRKLALEIIELRHDGMRDGKNVFKVRVRK